MPFFALETIQLAKSQKKATLMERCKLTVVKMSPQSKYMTLEEFLVAMVLFCTIAADILSIIFFYILLKKKHANRVV